MNHQLDIFENKLCNHSWALVDGSNLNASSLIKYKKALLNVRSDGLPRMNSINEGPPNGRYYCSQHMKNYLYNDTELLGYYTKPHYYRNNMGMQINNKVANVPMVYFVKRAFELLDILDKATATCTPNEWLSKEIEFLNNQWLHVLHMCSMFESCIPILDMDCYYYSDVADLQYLYTAIGYACMVCEKTTIGKRMMIVTNRKPIWVSFPAVCPFVSMVEIIRREYKDYLCSQPSSIIECVRLIGDTIRETKMCSETVEKMVLIVFNNYKNSILPFGAVSPSVSENEPSQKCITPETGSRGGGSAGVV
jgi:hypothetical protein